MIYTRDYLTMCASGFPDPWRLRRSLGWWCGARGRPQAAHAHHTTNERPERKTGTSRYLDAIVLIRRCHSHTGGRIWSVHLTTNEGVSVFITRFTARQHLCCIVMGKDLWTKAWIVSRCYAMWTHRVKCNNCNGRFS